MLVLTVEGDQARPELAQIADRGRAAVDVGAGAPVGADPPREHQLLLVCPRVGARSRRRLADDLRAHALGHREDPLDVGLLGAGAHDPGASDRVPSGASHQ